MFKLLVEKVIGSLYNSLSWTHAKCPSARIINWKTVRHPARRNFWKETIVDRSSSELTGAMGSSELSRLRSIPETIGSHDRIACKKSSFPLEPMTKVWLNRQSLEAIVIPISVSSRPFSHLSNRGTKITEINIGYSSKRMNSSDSHGKDRNEEKTIGKVEKNPKELEKPQKVSSNSCEPETKCMEESEVTTCHRSENRSNLTAADHDSSKLTKKSDPTTHAKSYESSMSYVDKMQECSAPRLRKRKSRSRENNHDQTIIDDNLSRKNESGKWKPIYFTKKQTPLRKTSTVESTGKSSRSRKSSSSNVSVHPPSLTISGRCILPSQRSTVADLGDERPNSATLKYRLSKCSAVNEAWRKHCKLPAVPPDPLPKPKRRATRDNRWRCDHNFRKSTVYVDTGKWRQQRYQLRQRIYKCSKLSEASNPIFPLDPFPASIVETSMNDISNFSPLRSNPNPNSKRQRCIGKLETRQFTKTYEMKMRESAKDNSDKNNRREKCNRNLSSN